MNAEENNKFKPWVKARAIMTIDEMARTRNPITTTTCPFCGSENTLVKNFIVSGSRIKRTTGAYVKCSKCQIKVTANWTVGIQVQA